MEKKDVKKTVREGYAKVAKQSGSCRAPVGSCCGSTDVAKDIGREIGYSDQELGTAPEDANLGLGCGNPVALASLREGEVVLDLGSGAGLDCFLAANRVGTKGRVIGVDMTPEMVERARDNAKKGNYDNVEFKLGEIESLPLPDESVDVVISNCVINLSPDKSSVFKEAFRVLKPGGRLMVSDMTLLRELPEFVKESREAYVACVAGAVMKDDYLKAIRDSGFDRVRIIDEKEFPLDCITNDPAATQMIHKLKASDKQLKEALGSVASICVEASKAI